MTKLVVAILLLALTMPASAEDIYSANHFLPDCKAFPEKATWKQARCIGLIEGLMYRGEGEDFCSPRGVTFRQAAAVVVKYIEARPERMHERFGKLAFEALIAAWPCKR